MPIEDEPINDQSIRKIPEANKATPPAVPALHKSKKATEEPGCAGCEYSIRLTKAHDDFACDHPSATWVHDGQRKVYTSQGVFYRGVCKGELKKESAR